MKKIFLLFIISTMVSCVSLTGMPENPQQIRVFDKRIDDSKISVVLESGDPELCADKEQVEFLKNVASKYFSITENQRMKIKIKESSTANGALGILNLAAAALTYSVIPMYDSGKYEIQIEITNDGSVKTITDRFVDERLVGVLLIPFSFNRSFYKVTKMKIEHTIYRMSAMPGVQTQAAAPFEAETTRLCTSGFHDFFGKQKW